MTIGDLKRALDGWPDDYFLIFRGLKFCDNRFKQRDDNLVQMEFNETISRDERGMAIVTFGGRGTEGSLGVDEPIDLSPYPSDKV